VSTASFLNWIVEGLALTSLVWLGLRVTRVTAATRYVIWWTTLVAVVALPVAARWMSGLSLASESGRAGARLSAAPSWSRQFAIAVPTSPEWLATSLMIAWLVVVAVMGVRFLGCLAAIRSLKRSAKPLAPSYEDRLIVWKTLRGRGRTVRLALSDLVAIPSVLGLGGPLIVLPESIPDQVSEEELDQIVAHEYAHVQRYDDWVGLVQLLVRMLLGFHPAVHWIHRELSLEREMACDDWVVALTGARSTYARLLTRLVRQPDSYSYAALSPGVARCRPAMMLRVMHLLDQRQTRSLRPTAAAPVAMAVMLIMTLGLSHLTPLRLSAIASVRALEARSVAPFWSVTPVMSRPSALLRDAASHTLARHDRPTAPPLITKRPVSPAAARAFPQQHPADSDVLRVSMASPVNAMPPATATLPRTELQETLLRSLDVNSRTTSVQTQDRAPWDVAADAGVAAGDRASAAGHAMAGVFTRFASSVARRF
jgi:bla regulator protein blaR1